ncbi:extracellular solute-binding protein [Paenibacillus donghaensis]|uniref:ABC transporter substrate-binding protein n=1 Tax=Paenibacillus donghaensis TaxID=414771 RepID=A0A2Z2KJI9_9BACL|nr:extracellular solute-binding protein [Paenibacillus donghaensis]ASA22479.1 ABC transporter substrate-binding protein [Paenibacillus donghaensis]
MARKNLGLLLLMLMLVLSACGNKAGNGSAGSSNAAAAGDNSGSTKTAEKTELNFYFTGSLNVKDMWEKIVPMFEAQNDNITVKLTHIPSGQGGQSTMDRLLAAKKAGESKVDIDLFEASGSDVLLGEKEGIFETVGTDTIPNISKIEPSYITDLNNLAVPYRASSVVLAYNSDTVANPPQTADELYEWIRSNPGRFAYNDPATGGAGNSFVVTALYNFLPDEAMHSQDPAIMEQWKPGFDLLKELHPFMYQKGVYPKKNQGTLDILATGEVDMVPAWSDMALEQLNKGLLPENIKLTQIEPAFTGGPAMVAIPAMSVKKEAAQKFIDYVLSQEAQETIVNVMFGYPGIKWSEMPAELQTKFESVAKGYRQFQGGELGNEITQRWQAEVATQ